MKLPKTQFKCLDSKTGHPLRIVADGAVSSSGICGGRLIPLVILDGSGRPDVEELFRVHHVVQGPGDVVVNWGQIENRENTVVLWLKFIRPAEVSLAIEFNVVGQGIIVDQALIGKGLYLQAGRDGDRLKHDLNRPKLLVEFGNTDYLKYWEKIFLKQHEINFRAKGLNRSQSRGAASEMLQQLRAVSNFRMPT